MKNLQSTVNRYLSGWVRLGLLFIIFILLKIPALQLPYFWDELGVYARAALYLHDHHLSLFPSALPPELSRGHPLLFSFIHGLSFDLFGGSVITGHITSFIISLSLLMVIYFITKKYFEKQAAFIAVVFLMVQPVFFAQSVMLLPEITLALFCLLAIWYWAEKKYLLYVLAASAAILTKETAVLIPVVVFGAELYDWQRYKTKKNINFKTLLIVFPLLVFGGFLVLQKQQNGWYLFPMHRESIHITFNTSWNYFINYLLFVFVNQGRLPATCLMVFFGALVVTKRLCICRGNKFILSLLLLIAGGIAFNALNFYMNRYTIFIICPLAILFGYAVHELISRNKYNGYFVGVAVVAPLLYLTSNTFQYDTDMSYTNYISVQQQSVDDVILRAGDGDSVFANFPVVYSFFDTRLGYCDTARVQFGLTDKQFISHSDYYLIANPGGYDHRMPATDSMEIIKVFENAVATITVSKIR